MTDNSFEFLLNYFTSFKKCEYNSETEKIRKEACEKTKLYLSDKAANGFEESFKLYNKYTKKANDLLSKLEDGSITKEAATKEISQTADDLDKVDDFMKEVMVNLENGRITEKHAAEKLFSEKLSTDEKLTVIDVLINPENYEDTIMKAHLQSTSKVSDY